MKDLEDIDIINQILKPKNPEKRGYQEELYKRYMDRVYAKSYFLTKDRSEAKDLTHDVFILVFTKLNTYKGLSPFFGWIDAIIYHHCLQYLRK
ncbi:MAG: DNA-directed RNA polymerase specialized sigma24 family protein [Arcticibacterium sp.]|jgi:DNA-directed RNA polymerase specialized sigma24 family protein